MTRELFRTRVTGSASPALLAAAHERLQQAWTAVPEVTDGIRQRMDLALGEAVGNVVQHCGDDAAAELDLVVTAEAVTAVLLADGPLVEVGAPMPGALAEDGRGFPLLDALLDDFRYRRVGGRNEFVLGVSRR